MEGTRGGHLFFFVEEEGVLVIRTMCFGAHLVFYIFWDFGKSHVASTSSCMVT